MKKSHLKLIMELIFIFILPLVFICFTSEIQVEREFTYDNNGNYETSEDTKKLAFDNSIIKYTNGYKNIINNFNIWDEEWELGTISTFNGTNEGSSSRIRSKNFISVIPDTTYYLLCNSDGRVCTYDSDYNFISYLDQAFNTKTIIVPSNAFYIKISPSSSYGSIYKDDICINISVSWANGNYIPYGEPLILYTQTDISGQNNINYTIWGNIKELLITNLDLNDNVLLDIVLCYMILWVINWIIWHLFYGFLELIIHIIPRKWERE